ncbi:hypothetical protein C8R47DRAFT_1081194 [Mycena vitilis]|nr:hypothetical protein C8R47DRAFT_1081194 [Mycena vitilis]
MDGLETVDQEGGGALAKQTVVAHHPSECIHAFVDGGGKTRHQGDLPDLLWPQQAGRTGKTSWVINGNSSPSISTPRRPGETQDVSPQQSLQARMQRQGFALAMRVSATTKIPRPGLKSLYNFVLVKIDSHWPRTLPHATSTCLVQKRHARLAAPPRPLSHQLEAHQPYLPQRAATKKPAKKRRPSAPKAAKAGKAKAPTTEDWYKSSRTKAGYANYVKSGKKWLLDWTAEGRLDDEISGDAFDVISEDTPLALRALTAYKCEHLERGFASAEGLCSAFKDYFERVRECQGEFWKYNSHTSKWEGNPVFESGFKTEEAVKYFTITQRLYFKVFATTAFILWTRNDELVNLQFKDIKMNLRSPTGIPYHEFSLKTNKDPTKVQKYKVQIDLVHPEMDSFTHLNAWKNHLATLLKRSLTGSDFVFPPFSSTGLLKFGECTSRSGFENLMDGIVAKSKVIEGRNGKFTRHCFRRGGAQYRFLFADRKWSLKAVKWWGGWSSNENVRTLMRYLLDELMAYEEGFSDIMMDDRVIDRHERFMGVDEAAPLLKADLLRFEESMLVKIQGLIEGSSGYILLIHSYMWCNLCCVVSAVQRVEPIPIRVPSPTPEPASPVAVCTEQAPAPSRIPETKTLDDALEYWERGSPRKGLNVPLKDWATQFKSSEYRTEAVKLGNIRSVCTEFNIQCGGDHAVFEERYPGLRRRFTMLMKAVRTERKLRGDAKSRNRRQ